MTEAELDIKDALNVAEMPAAVEDVSIIARHLMSLGWIKEELNNA